MSAPDWKEQIRALKRLKNLGQGDMEQLLRGLEDALGHAFGMIHDLRNPVPHRPATWKTIVLLHDVGRALTVAGLPATRWIDHVHPEKRSLWEEVSKILLKEAHDRGAHVQQPAKLRYLLGKAGKIEAIAFRPPSKRYLLALLRRIQRGQ
jgi:hypothetical protein